MKRPMWQDLLMILGFVLYLGAGFATKYIIAQVAQEVGFAVEAEQLESNPLMRQALMYRYGMLVVQVIAISMFAGVHWILRRTYLQATANKEAVYLCLSFYSISMFAFFLQNFMNDLPILLGILS
ncbi:MAG: hypothetical protein JJE48_06695 [Actinobacteria bacterium]|nr:hypothetical protein [Actinomycetota bacterium]